MLGSMTEPETAAAAVVDALRTRLSALHGEVQLVQTHISWVLLAGPYAYKLKKPVRFGFLDFSTLERRRHFCEEELRLNRRLAPDLCIAVLPVHVGADGPSFDGEGPVVEYALQMHRLPEGSLASERLARGLLRREDLLRLAERLADFHRDAPATPPDPSYGSATRVLDDALHAVDALAATGADGCAALRSWFEQQAARLAPRWEQRRRDGWVRELHGDLHLDNVLVRGDEVGAFDGIEFDPALRWIDPMCDLGFLLMDLRARGRGDLAAATLDRYLQIGGDIDGVALLRFYEVYRAVVRALVTALRARGGTAGAGPSSSDYLDLALRSIAPPRPVLLITHGLPGSGKTWLSQALLEQAGALRWRSDVERKRLAGLGALDDSRQVGDLYVGAVTDATYRRLLSLARDSIAAGYATLLDAAYLRRDQRAKARALADACGVPFAIVDCQADDAVLRQRLHERSARGGDASEADEAVLDRLRAVAEPITDDELPCTVTVRTDAVVDIAALAAQLLRRP